MHWPDGCSYVHADQPPRALRLGRAMVKHVCAVHPDLVRKADKDVRAQMRDGLVKATAPLIQDVVESKQHKEAVHAAWSKEKKRQRQRARGEARRGVQDEAGKAAEKSSRREDAFVLWLERKQEARERLLEERGKVRPPASSGRACAHARARARARAAALHKGVLPKRALLRLRLRLLRRNPPRRRARPTACGGFAQRSTAETRSLAVAVAVAVAATEPTPAAEPDRPPHFLVNVALQFDCAIAVDTLDTALRCTRLFHRVGGLCWCRACTAG